MNSICVLQIEAVHVRGGVNLLEVSMFQLRSWMNMFYTATSAEPTAEKSARGSAQLHTHSLEGRPQQVVLAATPTMCAWCLEQIIPADQQPGPHPELHGQTWCTRCVHEYHSMPKSGKCPAGVIFACIEAETGRRLLLFGLERNQQWCHFQGNADKADRNLWMVACREGAEESCYALGSAREMYVNYFAVKGKVFEPGRWGAFIVDLGRLTTTEREAVVARHKSNLAGAFGRAPTKCESEMIVMAWCDATAFVAAVEKATDKSKFFVPALDAGRHRFRSWALPYFKQMVVDPQFRVWLASPGGGKRHTVS